MHNDKIFIVIIELYKRLLKGNVFKIRMGIAKGANIRHLDWNEHVNLFGYGINLASRVMSVAEPNQILVHADYAEELKQIKDHPELTKVDLPKEIKHGEQIVVYNMYRSNEFGIAAK
jgi:class 3 adenylate cyclase